ncbi:MAG TPA: hypothetical protein VFI65_14955 [Streptosporangiaceae bacterium]|nr:hypothetical protein [Streptosporangiaceae bacterium]
MTNAKIAAVLATALMGLGLVAPVAASAAGSAGAAGKPPPNPCGTFTAAAAHRIFKVGSSTKLRGVSRSFGHGANQIRTCTIKHPRHVLVVNVARFSEDFGAPVKCYKRPKLGKHGVICVSTQKSFPITFALFRKDGVYFTDSYNQNLANKGARMYSFALAQYKAFKG